MRGRPLGTPLARSSSARASSAPCRRGKPVIGIIARGVSGKWAVPVRVPVIRDGEVRYVLTAAVKLDGIREVARPPAAPAGLGGLRFRCQGHARRALAPARRSSSPREPSPTLKQLMAGHGAPKAPA